MVSSVVVVVAAAAAYAVFAVVHGLRTNIRKARKTGLPYLVLPCSPFNMAWQLTYKLWMPLIQLLPARLWKNWLFVMHPDWGYIYQQEPYARLGDTFLTASPNGLILYTQSPAAIHQITARREHFPKATFYYGVLELFGRNLVTTEGAVWRLHRKATSASFNEKNAAHTFAETIYQTQRLLAKWTATAASAHPTITTVEQDTMTLALNIIGYVGFGLRFAWPGDDEEDKDKNGDGDDNPALQKYGSHRPPPPGYTMTFAASVEHVLRRIMLVLLLPAWLLRALAAVVGGAPREAYEANANYVRYMRAFLADKTAAVQAGDRGEGGMDIMGQLVRSRYQAAAQKTGGGASSDTPPTLTDDEIIGNAFIMLVAGHETTANTLHFTLLALACRPASQRALQADVDRLLGRASDPAADWRYEHCVPALLASTLGAAMNETLRLLPPVVSMPKWVAPPRDQVLVLPDGAAHQQQQHVLPAGLIITLNAVNAHRNPRYWPPGRGGVDDTNEYVPERWFRGGPADGTGPADATLAGDAAVDGADTEDYGGFQGPDTSAQLFRPVRGSFVPFSDGPRSCLGRRIAQVELVAALAVLFQRYSVELAVDGLPGGDDETVEALDGPARRALYAQAQARAQATLRDARSLLTLKLPSGAGVPLRLVPRGQERFFDCVEA